MPYVLLKLLSGGTYATGSSADWRAQFSGSTIFAAHPTVSGEVLYPGASSTFGVYAAFAFESRNPFDQTLCVPEASIGAPVQVYMNGTLVSEVTSPGTISVSAISGVNVCEVVRSQAPLACVPSGAFFDPAGKTGRWISLYPPGSDPFASASSGGAATKPAIGSV